MGGRRSLSERRVPRTCINRILRSITIPKQEANRAFRRIGATRRQTVATQLRRRGHARFWGGQILSGGRAPTVTVNDFGERREALPPQPPVLFGKACQTA